MMQLGRRKHLGSTWALKREHHQRELVLGQFGKRMPTFGKPIPTNDADGPTEALGQHFGSCKGAPPVPACFGAIRKKNASVRKTNSNKGCSWDNGSTWAALGLLKGSTISASLSWGDSENECQHSEQEFQQSMQMGQRKPLGSTWALERKDHQQGLCFGRSGKRMPTFGKPIPTNNAAWSTEALGQHLGS